ncbi:MAG: transketolase C-terminal domain-containing protein [Aliarcobacter sp.]|nr:transketolase C-terminal domain-containing protein [Aliarcobacter sp.]
MEKINIRKQFANTVLEIGKKDDRLTVLLGDIGHFNMIPFAEACEGRFYNVGICEPTIISMGAGLSRVGKIPVIHTINPFIVERSFEQLKLDFVYQKLAGNIITVGSLFDYSQLGCTHHCYGDFALLKTLFDVQIIYPATNEEFDTLFKQTYNNDKLTFFRIPEISHNIHINEPIKFGKAIKITEGKDLTIVVTGSQLNNVKKVQEKLKESNIEVEIIYIHTIRPLDKESIFSSVNKTKKVVVVEEHGENGGLGEDVLKEIYKINDLQFEHICVKGGFIHQYGTFDELLNIAGLTYENILKVSKTLL